VGAVFEGTLPRKMRRTTAAAEQKDFIYMEVEMNSTNPIKLDKSTATLLLSEILQSSVEDTFEQMIFKKYIEFKGAVKLVNYLNSTGMRVKTSGYLGERKYLSTDITDLVLNKKNHKGINKELSILVEYLIRYVGQSSWEARVQKGLTIVHNRRLNEL
jgi:hypothetical protein